MESGSSPGFPAAHAGEETVESAGQRLEMLIGGVAELGDAAPYPQQLLQRAEHPHCQAGNVADVVEGDQPGGGGDGLDLRGPSGLSVDDLRGRLP